MNSILSTAYMPPIEFFNLVKKSQKCVIEAEEYYQKQSYRTRCYILSSNGPIFLNIPIIRIHSKVTNHS